MVFGVTLGMAGAFVSTHWLASLLFGVTALDPATFAYVALALASVGILRRSAPSAMRIPISCERSATA